MDDAFRGVREVENKSTVGETTLLQVRDYFQVLWSDFFLSVSLSFCPSICAETMLPQQQQHPQWGGSKPTVFPLKTFDEAFRCNSFAFIFSP